MSLADDVLAESGYGGRSPSGYSPRDQEEDAFVDSLVSKYRQNVSQSDEGYLSKGLHAVGSVLGAPKAGIDYLARAGARAQGLNVPDTATTGEMMRNALGFNQGYETSGYGGRLGGKAVEFATDVLTDPVTYAMGAAPKPIAKAASTAFTGLMGAGALQEGGRALEGYQKEGFTPRVAEEALGAGLSGLGAYTGAKHLLPTESETVAKIIKAEPPEKLSARLDAYTKRNQPELADLVRSEMASRTAHEPSTPPVVAPEGVETALRAAEAQKEPTATPSTSTMPQGMNASWLEEIAKATDRHPEVDAATPEEAKAAVEEPAKIAEEAARKLQEAQSGPVPAVTEPVGPERGVSPVEGPLDADSRRDDGTVAAAQGATVEPAGVPTVAPDVVRQPEEALPVPPVGPNDTIPFPSKPPNPQRVALKAEVLRQRPNLDRDMVKRVFDEVEEGKREVEPTVNALLKMDQRYGPAPFRGWEGHLFNDKEQPSGLPPEKQAALKGVVENAPPEATDWIKESNAAAKAAEEARTGRQGSYDEGKARTQAERDAAAEELQPQYAVTYHGSPHKFNQFDMSKVGTGEGAQAYGHGLYFAENPEVAKGYQRKLTQVRSLDPDQEIPRKVDFKGHEIDLNAPLPRDASPEVVAGTFIAIEKNSPSRAIQSLNEMANEPAISASGRAQYSKAADYIQKLIDSGDKEMFVKPQQGNLYNVNIPDEHIAKMLDWDKPLSEQSEHVQQVFAKLLDGATVEKNPWPEQGYALKDKSGRLISLNESPGKIPTVEEAIARLEGPNLYGAVTGEKTAADASAKLNKLGIPGIKYLDQGSRRGGEGTRNFVVFDDKIPKILPEPSASVGGAVTPKPLTAEDIKANFKGYPVEPTEIGFKVTLPGGRKVTVEQTGHIDLNPEALEKGHGKAAVEGVQGGTQQIVGSYRRIGPESVIQVADQGTLPHEVWHGFMDHVASPKEKRIAERDFADQAKKEGRAVEEVAADSYRDYFNRRRAAEANGSEVQPKGFIDRVWSKVYEFFRNAYRSILPNMEYIQEQLYKGKPWDRATETAGATEPQYSTTPPPVTAAPEEAPKVPKEPGWVEKLSEYQRSAMVSALPTQAANPVSTVGEGGARVMEAALSGPVDKMLTMIHGGDRTRYSGEALSQIRGGMKAIPEAAGKFAEGFKKLLQGQEPPERPEYPRAIKGTKGTAIRFFLNMLGVVDDATNVLSRGRETDAQSYRMAKGLVDSGKATDLDAEHQRLMQNPTPELADQIERKVQEAQFKGDKENPQKLIKDLAGLTNKHPWLKFVFPFIQTPGHIAELAIQRSPLGFKRAYRAYSSWRAADVRGADPAVLAKLKGEAVDAIARPLVGTAILGTFAAYAKAGGMTGSGPIDPKERAAKIQTGWSPYSFVIPMANGKKAYIPFNRFEPISSILGFAADAAEMKDQKSASDMFQKSLGSVMQNLTSKTYLQGLSDAAEFIKDPFRMATKYAASQAGSFVPNILAKTAQSIDPVMRDTTPSISGPLGAPEGVLKTVASRLPFASQLLPERKTATGETAVRQGSALARFVSPSVPTMDQPGSELERLMVDSGQVPGQPSKKFTVPGTGGKQILLNDQEYKVLQQANKEAADYLKANLSGLQRLKPDEREKMIQSVFSKARTSARNRLMASPSFRARAKQEIASVGQS